MRPKALVEKPVNQRETTVGLFLLKAGHKVCRRFLGCSGFWAFRSYLDPKSM